MARKDYYSLLFGIRRSIRYHSRRQAFYESADRWTSLVLVILGTGSVALALQGQSSLLLAAGILVALVSGLQLVLAVGQKASRHALLAKDFTRIERRLVVDTSAEAVKAATIERLEIEATEPPVLRVLDVICHNELLRAMGYDDPRERVKVSGFQRIAANFFDWREHTLVKGG